MTKFVSSQQTIPAETVRVARAAFPKGNVYLRLRDELGTIFSDEDFADLYSDAGQGGLPAWQLALLSLVQFREGLTDRGLMEAVAGRIDLKYLLGLALEHGGYHYSVMSYFRQRLLDHQAEQRLLDQLLAQVQAKGYLQARGRQRTDSTHVLWAVRDLNRLELVGETLRACLNQLAEVAPQWLLEQVEPAWFERYSRRIEQGRLPKSQVERAEWVLQVGQDGLSLLRAIEHSPAYGWLVNLPTVTSLSQVWSQQYQLEPGRLRWRPQAELPPAADQRQSPYEPEGRNRTKGDLNWTGYSWHVTESCDPALPHLLTHSETTPATTDDVQLLPTIHQALAHKGLLPSQHLVDGAYLEAELIQRSWTDYQVQLIGPVPPDTSWQARTNAGFALADFQVDWPQQQVTCPQGQRSHAWRLSQDKKGRELIKVSFKAATCQACPCRPHCVRSDTAGRRLHLRPQAEYLILQQGRQALKTESFQQQYHPRAGIEGTISQAVRGFGLRGSRYLGLAKTRLQHVATTAALNISRLWAWWDQHHPYQPQRSAFAKLNPALA